MQTQWIADMFVLTLPVLEKVLRPVIVYFFLIIGFRLSGKRELAQLNPFDLVVLLTISNTVQNAIIGDDNSVTGGLIGGAALLLINYLVVRYLYGHQKLEEILEGQADYLIQNGKINVPVMEQEVISEAELEAAARKQGYASLDEIESATLEPGGAISFIPKELEPDQARHQELLQRLEQLTGEVTGLRAELARLRPS